jgi:hypothetical protein
MSRKNVVNGLLPIKKSRQVKPIFARFKILLPIIGFAIFSSLVLRCQCRHVYIKNNFEKVKALSF